MLEFEKAKEMLSAWKQHDIDSGFSMGVPDYPTNTRFVSELNARIAEVSERTIFNVLEGKQTRINAKEILEDVVSGYLKGTEYSAAEVLEIMGVQIK